jgi:hypothetical protein
MELKKTIWSGEELDIGDRAAETAQPKDGPLLNLLGALSKSFSP